MNADQFKVWLDKLEQYCARQERCRMDVHKKMDTLKIPKDQHAPLMAELTNDGFLDENRYARLFARGKMIIKKDGTNKIRYQLNKKSIPAALIDEILKDLDSETMAENIFNLAKKYWEKQKDKSDLYAAKTKLTRYLLGKGYRYSDIQGAMQQVISGQSHTSLD